MVSFHFFPFVTSTNQVAPASLIFNEHIPRSQLWKPLHSLVFQHKFSLNPFCEFLQWILSFVTCTSILAPAYVLSYEGILIYEPQKPLLQVCYGRSWCWSLVQINCILYMIYYLHNNIVTNHQGLQLGLRYCDFLLDVWIRVSYDGFRDLWGRIFLQKLVIFF